MCEIYMSIPACVEYEEARVSRDIDIEVEVRKQMYGIE
jgi:hypothetical protein